MQINIPPSLEFVYSINGMALERVDEIKDLGVIIDGRMSFHIEAIISKSSRMFKISKYQSKYFKGFS
jgi:hypothetical protein